MFFEQIPIWILNGCVVALAILTIFSICIGFQWLLTYFKINWRRSSRSKIIAFLIGACIATVCAQKSGENNDLVAPCMLAYSPNMLQEVESQIEFPEDFSTNGIAFHDFKIADDKFLFSVALPEDNILSNDAFDVFSFYQLQSTNRVRVARIPIWPQLKGVAFGLSIQALDDLYLRRGITNSWDRQFFILGDSVDTDEDGRTDKEEEWEYRTDKYSFDTAPEPEIPAGEIVLTSVNTNIMPRLMAYVTPPGKTIMHEENSSGKYCVATSGYYELRCSADDELDITVGPLNALSYWDSGNKRIEEGIDVGWLMAGEEYPLSYHFEDYGGPYGYTYAITPIAVTNCVPTLSVDPSVFECSPKIPSDAERMPEVRFTDPCQSCSTLSSQVINDTTGTNTWFKKIIYTVTQNGHDILSAECMYVMSKEKDKKDECSDCPCGEGSSPGSGCVSFTQRFGRTPRIPNLPIGRLFVQATYPTPSLFSSAALKYDHPMMRKILWHNGYDALIDDGLGTVVEYKDGKPVNDSAGLDSILYHDGTNYIERLASGLEVIYSQKQVAYLKQEYGKRIPISELGITVSRDANGAISSIASVADGMMQVENLGNNSWKIEWHSPAGRFVKSFTFGGNGTDFVTLRERRDDTFNFDYSWRYDPSIQDWIYTRGVGREALVETKEMSFDAANREWNVVRKKKDANGSVLSQTSSILNLNGAAAITTSRSEGSKNTYFATRDINGFISSETNSRGAATHYTRDRYGRVLTKVEQYADTNVMETTFGYAYGTRHNIDRRPTFKIVRINGVTVAHEIYHYFNDRYIRTRIFENTERTSRTEYDDYGREILSVGENGRAQRTVYSDVNGDGGWTETIDDGVYEDYCFVVVPGKSTRKVVIKDIAGNEIEQSDYALIGGEWVLLGWRTSVYDASHRVVSTANSNGKTSGAEWICTGPVWTRDEDGIVFSNEYNSVKALTKATRYGPFGAVESSYEYDGAGRIIRVTERANGLPERERLVAYDNRGRVVSETGFDGITVTTAYSADDKTETRTHPDGGVEERVYTCDGKLLRIAGLAVEPEYYSYGVTDGGATWIRIDYGAPLSEKYVTVYRNSYGEIIREERSGANGAPIVTTREYDNAGRMVKEVADGKPVKTFEYDDWGDVISEIETVGEVNRTKELLRQYEMVEGNVFLHKEESYYANGISPITTMSYTQMSGLSLDNEYFKEMVDKYGKSNVETSAFDPITGSHIVQSSCEARSNDEINVILDGVQVETVSASAITNRYSYNAYGQKSTVIDGRGNATLFEYDKFGNLVREIDALTNTISRVYDSMNQVVAVTNQLGNVVTYEYDLRGHKVYEGGAVYPVRYTYDIYGNRTSMTTYRDENSTIGDTTIWNYDVGSGLVTNKVYANGTGPSYQYLTTGNLLRRTWARGVAAEYSYDGWNNLISIDYSDDTTDVAITYDALGRKTSVVDAAGSTAFAYDDEFGDLVTETWGGLGDRALTRYRDTFGRDTGYSVNGSRKTIITYDSATGRISGLDAGGQFTWEYLGGTDLKSRVNYPNGLETIYAYEPKRDLLIGVANSLEDTVFSSYAYTNDATGRRVSKNDEQYGYNLRDELVSASSTNNVYSYVYDDIGNRITSNENGESKAYIANDLNQYSSIIDAVDAFVPQFDVDGNETLVRTSTGVWQVEYNGENRPVRWTRGNTIITMDFDLMGRRTFYREIENGNQVKFSRFFYDNYLMIQELYSSAPYDVHKEFIWDSTSSVATKPLSFSQNGKVPVYMTYDGNKNVSDIIRAAPYNDSVGHYDYAPFGAVRFRVGDYALDNPYRFSSEYFDDTLGLSYYNYRHYDPIAGRWISFDVAIDEYIQPNYYLFVLNNVFLWGDYLGMYPSSFDNPTSAVRQRGRQINPRSKREAREYCGCVCKICECGEWRYFTTQVSGVVDECAPQNAPCPPDSIWVSIWHTHGDDNPIYDNENFSSDDLHYADKRNKNMYLITPRNQFKQYVPGKGVINLGEL